MLNILVLMKMVSQATFTEALGGEGGSEERLAGSLCCNPADNYALELALRLKDSLATVRIIVMTMGPESAEMILRDALAMGADEAYHVCDRAYAGSDTLATAGILADAIRFLPVQDLILCGRKAIDSETGHIGPQLAALLGIPCISGVTEMREKEKKLFYIRPVDDSTAEKELFLPSLLTVVNGTSVVRRPTVMGLRRAKKAEITVIGTKTVLKHSSGTETMEVIDMPFSFRHGKKETDPAAGAAEIAKELGI